MGGLIVLTIAWTIIGIVVGALGWMIVRSNPPYGLRVEIGACVGIALLFGAGAWMGSGGIVRLVFSLIFSGVGAVATLWFLRWWKRRHPASEG